MLTVLMISLLASCGYASEAAEERRNALLESGGYSCEAKLSCDLGDAAAEYTVRADLGEKTVITVIEPPALAGLTAEVTGRALELDYQDALFACELPEDSVYPPVLLMPAAWQALSDGVLVASEKTEEGVRASFSRFEKEEEYIFTFEFANGEAPIRRITLEKNGRQLAVVTILRTL